MAKELKQTGPILADIKKTVSVKAFCLTHGCWVSGPCIPNWTNEVV